MSATFTEAEANARIRCAVDGTPFRILFNNHIVATIRRDAFMRIWTDMESTLPKSFTEQLP